MMPRLARHTSLDGGIIGVETPSRNSHPSGDVLNSACAPPSVRALQVIQPTASPTRVFAQTSAARVVGVVPCLSLSQAA
jgi:hypothetical protein